MASKARIFLRRKGIIAVLVVAIFLASGVVGGLVLNSSTSSSQSLATPAAVSSNGTISYGLETSVVQSAFNWWSPVESYYIVSMLYLPFASYQFPPGHYLNPILAQGWSHNANYTVWNLTLKKGLKWDNGSPLNSTDLWFSLMAYNQTGGLYGLNVIGDTILNSTTVQIKTSTPEPNFLIDWVTDTNSYIAPYQSWGKYDTNHTLNATDYRFSNFTNFKDIVADGPFVITNYTAGTNPIIFSANKYFYRGPPRMSKLSVRIFSSVSSMSAALRSGEISEMWDMGSYNTIVAPNFKNIPDVSVYQLEPGPYMSVDFNMWLFPYNTTQFRMALAYLTNRESLDSIVNSANGTLVGYNMLTSSLDKVIGINPSSVNNYSYNPTKAAQLLGQVGITKDNTSGTANYGLYVYNNPNLPDYGQPVTINITTTQLGFGDLSTAIELKDQWTAEGFTVNIITLSSVAFYPLIGFKSTGWDVAVQIDPLGYYPQAQANVFGIVDYDNSTGPYKLNGVVYSANHPNSFGMPDYNFSTISRLSNLSLMTPINTNTSNKYVIEGANYIASVVPSIPLWVDSNWMAVSNSYYWGNQTNHTGIFNTQALVQPNFWYGTLWIVHPISSTSSPALSGLTLYIIIGVVVAVVVIGSVIGVVLRNKKMKERM